MSVLFTQLYICVCKCVDIIQVVYFVHKWGLLAGIYAFMLSFPPSYQYFAWNVIASWFNQLACSVWFRWEQCIWVWLELSGQRKVICRGSKLFLSSKQGDSSSNHLGMWKIKTPMQYCFTVFSICCVWDVFLSCLVRFESEPKTEVGTKFGSKYNAAYKTLYWKRLLFIFDHQMAVWIHRRSVRCWRRLRSTGAFTNKQQTWIAI